MTTILPIAINMVAGVQIIVSALLLTSNNRLSASIGYILGISVATFTGVMGFYYLSIFFDIKGIKNVPPDITKYIQIGVCVLLIILTIKTYLNRKNVKEPKWMNKLENISKFGAFKIGLVVIFFMLGEVFSMLLVGLHLANHSIEFLDIIWFVFFVSFFVSIPLLFYTVFNKKMLKVLPFVKDWININSWKISISCYLIFVLLLLFS